MKHVTDLPMSEQARRLINIVTSYQRPAGAPVSELPAMVDAELAEVRGCLIGVKVLLGSLEFENKTSEMAALQEVLDKLRVPQPEQIKID